MKDISRDSILHLLIMISTILDHIQTMGNTPLNQQLHMTILYSGRIISFYIFYSILVLISCNESENLKKKSSVGYSSIEEYFKSEIPNRIDSPIVFYSIDGFLKDVSTNLEVEVINDSILSVNGDKINVFSLIDQFTSLSKYFDTYVFRLNENQFVSIQINASGSNGIFSNYSHSLLFRNENHALELICTFETYQSNPYQYGDLNNDNLLDVCRVSKFQAPVSDRDTFFLNVENCPIQTIGTNSQAWSQTNVKIVCSERDNKYFYTNQ